MRTTILSFPVFTDAVNNILFSVVDGLSTHTDSNVAAHLHGLAEISGSEIEHKQLLKGFYGTEVGGDHVTLSWHT